MTHNAIFYTLRLKIRTQCNHYCLSAASCQLVVLLTTIKSFALHLIWSNKGRFFQKYRNYSAIVCTEYSILGYLGRTEKLHTCVSSGDKEIFSEKTIQTWQRMLYSCNKKICGLFNNSTWIFWWNYYFYCETSKTTCSSKWGNDWFYLKYLFENIRWI